MRYVSLALALALTGCGNLPEGSVASTTEAPLARTAQRAWSGVTSYACQLQSASVEQLASSRFGMLIVDPDNIGPQVKTLGRLSVAYLSVGEAENYRSYWRPEWTPGNPVWLDAENGHWRGNYKVKFWYPAWESILTAQLDTIIDRGYDGVFLDVVDAYEYYKTARPSAQTEMKLMLQRLALRARLRGGADFGFFPNGGEALLSDPLYLNMITGIMKESMFFSESVATNPSASAAMQAGLRPAVNAGKLVLSLDYTTEFGQQHSAYQQARAAGFKEYVSVRALDRLVEVPGLQP